MDSLNKISPIDGRYSKYTERLAKFFSEQAFMRYRVQMEGDYLIALLKLISPKQKIEESKIIKLAKNFSGKDAKEIKKIEATTNHDLKAIEYWMKDRLPKDLHNWIHFGTTSEDATNIAYAMMVSESLNEVVIPSLEKILKNLGNLRSSFSGTSMLSRTHGQPASPTTFGKEMAIFEMRLERQIYQLKKWKAPAKLAGATGNYNALSVAYPKIDWLKFSKNFVSSYGFVHIHLSTQIESHDLYAELFDVLRRINTILINLNQDIWRYVSDGWLRQVAVKGEVGSSTMPHKINPWFFENSEGNLGMANSMFQYFSSKLPISRLQRDLSDSTVERNIGVAFSHSLIGFEYLLKGLSRIDVDEEKMMDALNSHVEVIAEGIQTILRREGVEMPYEKLKELTRGKSLKMSDMLQFIEELEVSDSVKKELRAITPSNYIGLAEKLAS